MRRTSSSDWVAGVRDNHHFDLEHFVSLIIHTSKRRNEQGSPWPGILPTHVPSGLQRLPQPPTHLHQCPSERRLGHRRSASCLSISHRSMRKQGKDDTYTLRQIRGSTAPR